jgi:hypothetical protein
MKGELYRYGEEEEISKNPGRDVASIIHLRRLCV